MFSIYVWGFQRHEVLTFLLNSELSFEFYFEFDVEFLRHLCKFLLGNMYRSVNLMNFRLCVIIIVVSISSQLTITTKIHGFCILLIHFQSSIRDDHF